MVCLGTPFYIFAKHQVPAHRYRGFFAYGLAQGDNIAEPTIGIRSMLPASFETAMVQSCVAEMPWRRALRTVVCTYVVAEIACWVPECQQDRDDTATTQLRSPTRLPTPQTKWQPELGRHSSARWRGPRSSAPSHRERSAPPVAMTLVTRWAAERNKFPGTRRLWQSLHPRGAYVLQADCAKADAEEGDAPAE